MAKVVAWLETLFRKYTPDPFVFAVGLSLFSIILATAFTDSSLKDSFLYWGDGLWTLLKFTLQMAMILLTGFILATSPIFKNILDQLSRIPKNETQALIAVFTLSAFAAWLNWGFGLIIGAFATLSFTKSLKNSNFPLFVATSYCGFIFWHGGLSGSIPLAVNSSNKITQNLLSSPIPVSETIFSNFNLILIFTLYIAIVLTAIFLLKKSQNSFSTDNLGKNDNLEAEVSAENTLDNNTLAFAERISFSRKFLPTLFVVGLSYLSIKINSSDFRLNLNNIIFITLFLGVLFHPHLKSFLAAVTKGSEKLGPILIQYPLYAATMNVLNESGLANLFTQSFIENTSQQVFPLLTFFSAGIVNFFVPSGGGQWAIQGPIVIPASIELGADLSKSILAVAWGDAWTNLIQPFWALPILSLAGIAVKEILGYCFIYLLVSGSIISLFLLF